MLPRDRALRRLLVSHALTSTAQTFAMVPVAVVLYDHTRSTAWVAAAAAAHYLPHLLLSGPAGVLADRCNRLQLLRWSSATRAAVLLALAVAVGAVNLAPVPIVALVALVTVFGTPAAPALMASVPQIVPAERLVRANATVVGLDSLAFVAGPAVGGALLIVVSPALVLVAGAFLFLAGWFLVPPLDVAPAHPDAGARSVVEQFLEGARAVMLGASTPLVLLVAINLIYGATVVLLVPVARELLHTGQAGVGALNLAIGVGSVLGLGVSSRLAARTDSRPVHAAALLGTGLPLAVLALWHSTTAAHALMALSGAASMVAEVLALTWLQRSLPAAATGRAFGILETLAVGAILAGSTAAPVLERLVGLAGTLVVVGVVVPALAVAAARSIRSVPLSKELL